MKRSAVIAALMDAAPSEADPEVVLDIRRHAIGFPVVAASMGDPYGNDPTRIHLCAAEEKR